MATIAMLVLLPALVGADTVAPWQAIGIAILKTAIFIGIMIFAGAKVMPWLLTRIASTQSRELFILAVVALALGTALGAAELFGVSLALGAFLAGAVIGESEVSHQVGAEVLPFRDIFAVLFFVSVGMLVNPAVLVLDRTTLGRARREYRDSSRIGRRARSHAAYAVSIGVPIDPGAAVRRCRAAPTIPPSPAIPSGSCLNSCWDRCAAWRSCGVGFWQAVR